VRRHICNLVLSRGDNNQGLLISIVQVTYRLIIPEAKKVQSPVKYWYAYCYCIVLVGVGYVQATLEGCRFDERSHLGATVTSDALLREKRYTVVTISM
jgi:hypothetical protein